MNICSPHLKVFLKFLKIGKRFLTCSDPTESMNNGLDPLFRKKYINMHAQIAANATQTHGPQKTIP